MKVARFWVSTLLLLLIAVGPGCRKDEGKRAAPPPRGPSDPPPAAVPATAAADDPGSADHWFQLAVREFMAIDDQTKRGEVLNRLVEIKIDAGDLDTAGRFAHAADKISKPWLLVSVAEAQAGKLDFAAARATAKAIASESIRPRAYRLIALAQARASRANEALATVKAIAGPGGQSEACKDLAVDMAVAGRIDLARRFAGLVTRDRDKAEADKALTAARIAASGEDLAAAAAKAKVDLAELSGPLQRIAAAASAADKLEDALRIASQIPDAGAKVDAYRQIAARRLARGDQAGCKQAIGLARAAVKEVPAGPQRGVALAEVARGEVAAGDLAGAGRSLQEAMTTVGGRPAPHVQSAVRELRSHCFLLQGKTAEGLQTVRKPDGSYDPADCFAIARALTQTGAAAERDAWLAGLKSGPERAQAYLGVAAALGGRK